MSFGKGNDCSPLIIYTESYGHLSEVWIHRQVRGLEEGGGNVSVAAWKFLNAELFPVEHAIKLGWSNDWAHRISHLYWGAKKRRWVFDEELSVLQTIRQIRSVSPKLLHCHFLWNGAFAANVAKRLDIPLIVTAHGSDVNRARVDLAYRNQLQPVFEYSSCIIAVSEFIARILVEIGCPEQKIEIIRLGAPIPSQTAPRKRDLFRWICVASLLKVKGHEYLIRAFAKALQVNPDMELVLVGDGGLRHPLENLVSELGVAGKVRFTGTRTSDEVARLLLDSHGFVLASIVEKEENKMKEEGLPISLVEAAAAGLPLVATNCGGIPEICRHGENGILVPCRSVHELTVALLAVARDQNRADAMGVASRALVEREYNVVKQNQKLAELYSSLLFANAR